jgi:D-alanyl-D-alanine carboxypeptidase
MRDERESLDKKLRKKFIKMGQKNWFTFLIMVPVLVLTHLFFRFLFFLEGNKKRLTLVPMILFIFAAFCSFSFPIFIQAESVPGRLSDMPVLSGAVTVTLAPEEEIGFEDVLDEDGADEADRYDEQNVPEEEEAYRYDVDEILEYNADLLAGEDLEEGSAEEGEDQGKGVQNTDTVSGGDSVVFSKDDWQLILINKQHPIPDDYSFQLATIKGSSQCDERILKDLLAMLQAAKNDGVNLVVRSPYRTEDRQEKLFVQKIKNYMNKGMTYMEAFKVSSQTVTVPGSSEHQVGLALDITCDTYPALDAGFGDTEAGKWLAANGADYGFILRYPLGKEYITGIEFEPWHYRYVGEQAARVIMGEGITLEEFWERL